MKLSIILGGACALPPEAIGAIEILWFNIGKIFSLNGHDVTLLGKGDPKIDRNDKNFSCRVFRGFSPGGRCVTLIRALGACFQMFRMLDKCDVLVVNNVWAVLVSRFFRHKFRILVNHIQRMPKGCFALRQAGADLYICPTNEVARRVREAFHGKYDDKIIVIPNPVDVSYFSIDSREPNSASKSIAYHGRIHQEKGLHILAKAVAIVARSYPEIRLKLIGAYDIKQGGSGIDYKRQLDMLSGGRIDWVNPISDRNKLARAVSDSIVYCYPSIAEKGETFGVAPLEAMGLGKPVIVSSLKCFEDFVQDGVSGLVFDHRNKEPEKDLANQLFRVLSDSGLREKLAINASCTSKRFATERVASMMEDVFNKVLEERVRR